MAICVQNWPNAIYDGISPIKFENYHIWAENRFDENHRKFNHLEFWHFNYAILFIETIFPTKTTDMNLILVKWWASNAEKDHLLAPFDTIQISRKIVQFEKFFWKILDFVPSLKIGKFKY